MTESPRRRRTDAGRAGSTGRVTDQALHRVVGEIREGLRHGYFEYAVTCDLVGQERRRLTIHAGKSYQFTIPKDECVRAADPLGDSSDRSDDHVK